MKNSIEENFNKKVRWLLSELKEEEMANSFSDYKIKFFLISPSSEEEPNQRSQMRVLKMLSDKKALSLTPFYTSGMGILDSVLQMQGAKPIGYYIQIVQPAFNEIFEEYTNEKAFVINPKTETPKLNPPADNSSNTYFISLRGKQVLVNSTFLLSSPRFDSENDNFIDYVTSNPGRKLTKEDIEKGTGQKKLKKSLKQIITDLGFSGEIRKLFFNVSKTAVYFRNNITESELGTLNIDKVSLDKELSALDRIGMNQNERD